MESEVLPGDGGWVQRSRSMWTCDHYIGLGGQFLDGSYAFRPGDLRIKLPLPSNAYVLDAHILSSTPDCYNL